MSTFEKRIRKIVQNPKEASFETIKNILLRFEFLCKQPSGGSSHYIFKHPIDGRKVTVPYNRPCVKEFYVKEVIKILNLEDYDGKEN